MKVYQLEHRSLQGMYAVAGEDTGRAVVVDVYDAQEDIVCCCGGRLMPMDEEAVPCVHIQAVQERLAAEEAYRRLQQLRRDPQALREAIEEARIHGMAI